MAGTLVRNAKLAAIVHASRTIDAIITYDDDAAAAVVVGKKRKLVRDEAPHCPRLLWTTPGRAAVAYLQPQLRQQHDNAILRALCGTDVVAAADVQPACLICLSASGPPGYADAAAFAIVHDDDDTSCRCCGDESVHAAACPLTRPGAVCLPCAAAIIRGGYERWQSNQDAACGAAPGRPRCPLCRSAVCERKVRRSIILQ